MNNVIAYSAQVLLLIAAGAVLPLLFRIALPKPRLWYWQGLLAVCLLLPIVQPRQQVNAINFTVNEQGIQNGPLLTLKPQTSFSLTEIAFGIYCAGLALRGLWLILGCIRLWRYKRNAAVLEPMIPAVLAAQDRLLLFPDIRISHEISSPVTFVSVILFPVSFLEMQPEAQQAIAVHELIHVQRRDWQFNLAEEIIRSVLWFHPAISWLLAQIQLTREQVVDRATVAFTQSREQYLEALLAVAETKIRPDLALAPLFLKKRHLARRVAAVMKEIHMSKRQITYSLATALTLSLVTATIAVWIFPLEASAQEFAANPASQISVDTGGRELLHSTPIEMPPGRSAAGEVVVQVKINGKGEVLEGIVQSGPEELRNAVLASVLQWHFDNRSGAPDNALVTVKFQSPSARIVDQVVSNLQPSTIAWIMMANVPPGLAEKISSRLALRPGDQLTKESLAQARQALRELDEHLTLGVTTAGSDNRGPISHLTVSLGTPPQPPPPPVQPFDPPAQPGVMRIRIGGMVQSSKLIQQPIPAYPALAKQARIQGVVRYNALIGVDGLVKNLQVVSGHPLLIPSATDAVKLWRYQPTTLNGEAVEVITVVDVNFTLRE